MRIRRSIVALILAGAFTAFGAIPGCASADERNRAAMHKRMGKLPEKYKNDGAPKVGDTAYLFTLKTVDGDREVNIASSAGETPVVLFFGSYT